MDEEEVTHSGRSLSPYHQKCFPPYCDNAGQIDKQVVAKMSRNDLEDKYIIFADENFAIKKQLKDQQRQIKRLNTAIARQDQRDKKLGITPTSTYYDSGRVNSLEAQNKHLQAKIKVLKQQLMNHSFIHSKEHRIAESREKQRRGLSPETSFRDVGQTQSARDHKYRTGTSPTKEANALKERIDVLEQLLETQKEKYKARIAQLEKELAEAGRPDTSVNEELDENSKIVSENVELIKLQRQNTKQADEIATLTAQLEAAKQELNEQCEALNQASEHADELERQLEIEKNRMTQSQSQLSKTSSHAETIRALQEQIRDLQNERNTLKETNEQLLILTSGSQKGVKFDKSAEIKLKQQISTLELKLKDKIKELDDKEEQLVKMESLLKKESHKSIPETGEVSQSHTNLVVENEALKNQLENLKQAKEKEKEILEVKLNGALAGMEQLKQQLNESGNAEAKDDEAYETLKAEYSCALEENERLKTALENANKAEAKDDEAYETLKAEYSHALEENERLKTALENANKPDNLTEENARLEKSLNDALKELDVLRIIANEHQLCSKSTPRTPPPSASSTHTLQIRNLTEENERLERNLKDALRELEVLRVIANEHQNCPKKQPSAPPSAAASSVHLSKSKSHTSVPPPAASEHELKSQPSKPMKDYSSHHVQQVPGEPPQTPVLVIVSKHEFDAILLNKKKFYSETEMVIPTLGNKTLNCRLEICVYDLEVDRRMIDYLSNIEEDPHVFVTWNFVGLEQRTATMPASHAQFQTNVTYIGPLSQNVTDYLNERTMPVYLMMEKSNSDVMKIGEGQLDLTPAFENPSKSFVRCVSLAGGQGSANVYCSFKLHDCCEGELHVSADSLEVGIGHLRLKNTDFPSTPNATHLYIEYALLGHCGSELETDSVPKGEVMRFNHTKRVSIDEENAPRLQPLLQRNNAQALRFILLAEPCNLADGTEVEEVGHAEINLMQEMVEKDQDLLSVHIPVFTNEGENLGSLSVTVIGISTLQKYAEHKTQS